MKLEPVPFLVEKGTEPRVQRENGKKTGCGRGEARGEGREKRALDGPYEASRGFYEDNGGGQRQKTNTPRPNDAFEIFGDGFWPLAQGEGDGRTDREKENKGKKGGSGLSPLSGISRFFRVLKQIRPTLRLGTGRQVKASGAAVVFGFLWYTFW